VIPPPFFPEQIYSCGSLTTFAITPQGANNCAGVNGNAISPNFINTPYGVVPSGQKAANMVFSLTSPLPAAYSAIYGSQSPSGPFVPINAQASPPSPPDASNSVSMCLYSNTGTIPPYAYYVLTMVNPATGDIIGNCTYVEVGSQAAIMNSDYLECIYVCVHGKAQGVARMGSSIHMPESLCVLSIFTAL